MDTEEAKKPTSFIFQKLLENEFRQDNLHPDHEKKSDIKTKKGKPS